LLPPNIRCLELGGFDRPEQLADVYPAADVFVIPSLEEAFGQTALEAMACGVPVVGFETGGIPDIIRPGKTGLLAPVGNSAELARQLQWMINHPAHRLEMGIQARAVAESEYSMEMQSSRYMELYGRLTGV
jgi:glycosyltransferase involved in cell wall biosynthesis